MTVEELVDSYCAYNGISHARHRALTRVMRDYLTYAGRDPSVDLSVDAAAFRAWMTDRIAGGLKVSSVVGGGKMVRALTRYLVELGIGDEVEALRLGAVKNPRCPPDVPNPYTADEITRLYREIDARWPLASVRVLRKWAEGARPYRQPIPSHMMHFQIKAIVALALDCGMRRNEMYQASIHDISFRNELVVVRHGKSSFADAPLYREVPFTEEARTAVEKWMILRSMFKPNHDRPWLIVSTRCPLPPNDPMGLYQRVPSDPMGFRRFSGLFRSLPTPWRLHRLRHTAATVWLRSGVPLEIVSRFLGHSDIQQTLAYAQLDTSDIGRHLARHEYRFRELIGNRT